MERWYVRFLGVPGAVRGDATAHLRSRDAWAVLACMLLPPALRGENVGEAFSREALADRFWSVEGSVDPRTHLRQCIASIKKEFGTNILVCRRNTVGIADAILDCDIGRIMEFHQRASRSSDNEERLRWLLLAVAEVKGEFFEGWTPSSDDAQLWLAYTRSTVNTCIISLLLDLAQAFEAAGNGTAAFETVLRALQVEPGNSIARQKAWDLAIATGRQQVVRTLERVESFKEAVDRLDTIGITGLNIRDHGKFSDLLTAHLNSLPRLVRRAVLRLATVPGLFSYDLAKKVCRIDENIVNRLIETGIVSKHDDCLEMRPIIRDCAELLAPAWTRARLQQRLARFCISVIEMTKTSEAQLPPPFNCKIQSRKLLGATVEWVIHQKPDHDLLEFMRLLPHCGYADVARAGNEYIETVTTDLGLPLEFRIAAHDVLYRIQFELGDFAGAGRQLNAALQLTIGDSFVGWRNHFTSLLCLCMHHSGDADAALEFGLNALEAYRKIDVRAGVMDMTRVMAEVYCARGEFQPALELCEESISIRRELRLGPDFIADALYWKAHIVLRSGDYQRAEPIAEEALTLWQQAEDTTGVALCLKLIARIYACNGRLALSRSFAEHAIELHSRQLDESSRISAVTVLGDTLFLSDEYEHALKCFDECIAYFTDHSRPDRVTELEAQRELCIAKIGIPMSR